MLRPDVHLAGIGVLAERFFFDFLPRQVVTLLLPFPGALDYQEV